MALGSLECTLNGAKESTESEDRSSAARWQWCSALAGHSLLASFNGVFGGGVLPRHFATHATNFITDVMSMRTVHHSLSRADGTTSVWWANEDSQPTLFHFFLANLPAHTNSSSLLGTSDAIIEAFKCLSSWKTKLILSDDGDLFEVMGTMLLERAPI